MRSAITVLAIASIYAPTSARAQATPERPAPPPSATFKSTARVVNVNVVVSDSHGNPITGLTKDDFELFDNGKRQDISFFQVIKNVAPPPVAPIPPDTYTNLLPDKGIPPNAVALFVDIAETRWVAQYYALERVRAFLRQMHPEDRVALYVQTDEGLKFLHDFTRDTSELRAAIQKYDDTKRGVLRPGGEESELDRFLAGGYIKFRMEEWAPAMTAVAPPEGMSAKGIGLDNEHSAYPRRSRASAVLATLPMIARHLASAPGRKSLVWVSERVLTLNAGDTLPAMLARRLVRQTSAPPKYHGFKAALLGPNGPSEVSDRALRDIRNGLYSGDLVPLLTRLFNDNDIAVYPVAAEGLQTADLGFRDPPIDLYQEHTYWHEQMEDLAARTGGRTYLNRNDLETGMERALDDGRHTYELAYYPRHGDWTGEWRKIEVKLKHPERYAEQPKNIGQEIEKVMVGGFSVHVLSRGGYLALPEPKVATNTEAPIDRQELLTKALEDPSFDTSALPFTVHIATLPEGSGVEMGASISVDAHRLFVPEEEGRWKANIELLFAQLGADDKVHEPGPDETCCTLRHPIAVPVKTINLDVNADQYQTVLRTGISAVQKIDITPGAKVLSVVVHDKNSDAVGLVRIPLAPYAAQPTQ